MKKRGFVTVATGDYYCRLAENLIMSYRLFSDTTYPMYVMTDQKGAKRLKKLFDGVVVLKEPYYTFMDKMTVYQDSPFEETIFIDADANIVSDISYLFDDFAQNGSAFSCVGSNRCITETNRPIHFGDAALRRFGIDRYISMNGGVYYFRKDEKLTECMSFIFEELVPNYKRYELKEFRNGQMADEPLYGLAAVVFGFEPLSSGKDIMKLMQDSKTLSWDMKARKCGMIWYGMKVSPAILHYGTHNTYTRQYVYYNAIVKCMYQKRRALIPFCVVKDEFILLCRHISRKEDRQAFYSWFFAHFTKAHFHYRIGQLKGLFRRHKQ